MGKSRPRAIGMPFRTELGPRVGNGQDNAVFRMVHPATKPHLRPASGQVLKVNHKTPNINHVRDPDNRTAAWAGVQYKKNKYEILKLFLGDFVPRTSFVLGKVTEGSAERYAEYTIQDEVPRVSLGDLTEEQKRSPILKQQVVKLMGRLGMMYQTLGEANARTSSAVNLDGKMDLGGVSDYVRADSLDRSFVDTDAEFIINQNNSPNLLVDPSTMSLYCIDFDQGQWKPGMDEAKNLVFELASSYGRVAKEMGSVAVSEEFPRSA